MNQNQSHQNHQDIQYTSGTIFTPTYILLRTKLLNFLTDLYLHPQTLLLKVKKKTLYILTNRLKVFSLSQTPKSLDPPPPICSSISFLRPLSPGKLAWEPDKSASSCFICSCRHAWPPSRSERFLPPLALVGPITTVFFF